MEEKSGFKKNSFWAKKIPRGKSYLYPGNIIKSIVKLARTNVNKNNYVELFEKVFAKHFNVDSAIVFPYARTAFHFIFKAYNFPSDAEILITPVTTNEIINVILLNGLKPVFVDLGHNTGNIQVDKIEEAITKRTKALLVTHLNGVPSKMDLILKIKKKYDLVVFEDASQCIGAKYKNSYVGSFVDAGVFSTSFHKPLSTFTGGVVITNNNKMYKKLKEYVYALDNEKIFSLINSTIKELVLYIFSNSYVFSYFTFYFIKLLNSFSSGLFDKIQHFDFYKPRRWKKMPKKFCRSFSPYQAIIGLEAFKTFQKDTKRRSHLGYLLFSELKKNFIPGLLEIPSNSYCIFWRFPLWVDNPEAFRRYLFNRGVGTAVSGLDCYSRSILFKEFNKDTPEAFNFIDNMVFLPIYPSMNEEEVKYIAYITKRYYENN